MADLGHLSLMVGLALAVYATLALFFGARRRLPELIASGRNAVWGALATTAFAFVALEYLMVRPDFSVAYVASHTSIGQPLFYTITGIWGGQEGSLLFWAFVLCIYTAAVMYFHRDDFPDMMPYVVGVMTFVLTFFLLVLNFEALPFRRLGFIPPDGQGLNPLLQNPSMILHPPMLYSGFVGFTAPFAFAMAALLSGRTGASWVRLSRRWTLVAWMFLSIGILLGANWAYNELGWGGYWAWDPVENASLMPWLVGTAFLHSVMVQEHRGMLKVWNVVLIILTFALSIFGTFLTRSGVIESIHAFAVSNIGTYFLSFIGLVVLGSLFLLFERLDQLKADNELDSLVSRESAFLLNNIVFLGLWFAIFWGTIYPIVSEGLTGTKIFVGPPYFNQVAGPIILLMLALMGVAPLLPWRRASRQHLLRNLVPPLVVALVVVAGLVLAGYQKFWVLVALGIAAFVAAGHVMEFWRGVRAQRQRAHQNPFTALSELIGRNRRRYGGYIIHLGVVFMVIGIVGSNFYKIEKDVTVKPGESFTIGTYQVETLPLRGAQNAIKQSVIAPVQLSRNGTSLGELNPGIDFHFKVPGGQRETEVAVRSTPVEDFYIVLAGVNDDNTVTFKIFINPLVFWLWVGGVILVAGTWVAFWPDPREERILERVRARELALAS
ncbi:MAG: heme lyase CcmF/NrfE family subunit [Ardenticatenaceae bacterium]|nr:heme lyase CcmF/NrfE family subunit [Ardenticatenaceae bacterium]HBY95617.1 cytochrome C biogenesis protein [Chloroflexota bacterium]